MNTNEEVLTEAPILKKSDLITIDPFYSISAYNEALHALENNGVEYKEYISTITPFNFYIQIDGGQKPIMMNYEKVDSTNWRWLVSKVQPLKTNDEVKLFRRTNKQGNIREYINNDAFEYSFKQDYTLIFHYKNKQELFTLSEAFGLIIPLGKYMNGGIHLAMAFNRQIKNGLTVNNVLLEKIGKQKVGHLEAEINFKILRNMDKIEKWSMTPRFKDGKFFPVSPKSPLKI